MGERAYKGHFEDGQFYPLEPANFPMGKVDVVVTVKEEKPVMPFDEWKMLMDRLFEASEHEDHLLEELILEKRQPMRTIYDAD